jgi:hypothetical protein
MLAAIRRNAIMLTGIAAAAWFLIALVSPALRSDRGEVGPLVTLAQAPVTAAFWLAAGLVVLLVIAIGVGRLTTTNRAMFTLGAGLMALAMRFSSSRALAFADGSLLAAAIETLVWAVVVLAMALAVFRLVGPLGDIQTLPGDRSLVSKPALMGAGAMVLTLPLVWLLARHDLKGQALGAVVCGSMVAGLAARLVSPRVQPVLFFAAPVTWGAVGHLIAYMLQNGSITEAPATGSLSRLAYPMPIDYAAGALVGVSIGIAWARSFSQAEQGKPASAVTREVAARV